MVQRFTLHSNDQINHLKNRWLKYEEKVEAGGRWSKPHVCTASLHSLFELRRSIEQRTCHVLLDIDPTTTAAAAGPNSVGQQQQPPSDAAAADSMTVVSHISLDRLAGIGYFGIGLVRRLFLSSIYTSFIATLYKDIAHYTVRH